MHLFVRCRPRWIKIGLALALVLTFGVNSASADTMWTFSGTNPISGDPVSGTFDASVTGNTIQVTLADTSALPSSGNWDISQAMADVGFQVSGLTGSTASITNVSGTLVTWDSTTSKWDTSTFNYGTDTLTWEINNNSSVIDLGTIGWTYDGLPVGKAPPNELIANGTYENDWNSSLMTKPHNPSFLSSVTFTIDAPGVSSSSLFSNVQAAFGTGTDVTLSGTPLSAVPAPPSVVLLGIGLAVIVARACLARSWRRRAAAA
jgi:hypothetical protein